MEDRYSDSSSENYITPPSSPPRDSYNISIITSLSTDILPFKSYTSASINSSGSKPSYAAIVAKSLPLPPPATVAECSSAPAPSLLANDSHPAMGEGLKLSSEELSKGLTDGSSSPQLQGPQSPPSPLEKQEVISDDTLPMPTNHQQELTTQNSASSLTGSHGESQSAIHGATLVTGSHNSSLNHGQHGSQILNVNVVLNKNISIIPSRSTDKSDASSTAIKSSSSKPTYAAIVANKSLSLPVAVTVAECSFATAPSLPENDSHPKVEGLKLSEEESSEGLTDRSPLLQVQGPQSPHSPSDHKQVTASNETLVMPTSHGQPQSAIHATTSAAGSRNSSLTHNTQRSIHPRSGHGSQHHHHGINQNRNTHKSFYGRNMHMRPPTRGLTMSARPPLPSPLPPFPARLPWLPPLRPLPSPASYSYTQYFPQPLMPSYGVYYEFPDFGSHIPYHSTPIPPLNPFIPAPYVPSSIRPYPVNFVAYPDPELHAKIVKQIDYYFSFPNLVKDTYLRKQMDDEGWVPIGIVAGFPEVKKLTNNIKIIKDALQASSVIEILGDKIRPVDDDPKRWVISDELKQFFKERSKELICNNNQADTNQSPEDKL